MKIYLDDVEIEVETIKMFSKGTIVKPEPKPPKDDTPPVRPVEPDTSLTVLTKPRPQIVTHMPRDKVYTEGFVIPENTTVPVVFFSGVPQNTDPANITWWISETPDGPEIPKGKVSVFARRGDQVQLVVALDGRGAERRGAVVKPEQPFYLNMSSDKYVPMWWRITGNF
jgi:hypothetical protein